MRQFGGSAKSTPSKLQTRVRAAAAAEAHAISILPHLTISFSMRCDTRATPGGQAALEAAVEAALRGVATEFKGQHFMLGRTRVGPSEDTLQQVLSLVVAHVEPEDVRRCSEVSTWWRRELEARGFCKP